jgi:hypothetical protein
LVLIKADAVPRSRRLSTLSPLADEAKAIIQKHITAARGKEPPSIGATPSAFPTTQADDPILNGRPFTTRATPVHLYHNVFNTFTNIYHKTEKIPADVQKDIFELCETSSRLYQTIGRTRQGRGETKRVTAIRPIYQKILNESIHVMPADDSEADGVITTRMGDGQLALRGILEDKNEVGAGGCDPNLQGCLSYIKYWSMNGACAYPYSFCSWLTFLL